MYISMIIKDVIVEPIYSYDITSFDRNSIVLEPALDISEKMEKV